MPSKRAFPDAISSPVRTRRKTREQQTTKSTVGALHSASIVPIPLQNEAKEGIFLGKPVAELKMQELRRACDFLKSTGISEPIQPRPRKKIDLLEVVVRMLAEWAKEEKDVLSSDSIFGTVTSVYEDRHGRNWEESSVEEPSPMHNYSFSRPDEDGPRILHVPATSTPKPTQVHLTAIIPTKVNEVTNVPITGGFDMSRFAPPKGHWKCNACLVYNAPSISRCQACETNRE